MFMPACPLETRTPPRHAGALGTSARALLLALGRRRDVRLWARFESGIDADAEARAVLVLELHDAVDQGVDRVIRPHADVAPRVVLRAALTDDDVPRAHALAAELFDAPILRVAVTTVAAGADALLVCHERPSAEGNVVDTDFGEPLPVPLLPRVVLPALELENDDLLAAAVPYDLPGDASAL